MRERYNYPTLSPRGLERQFVLYLALYHQPGYDERLNVLVNCYWPSGATFYPSSFAIYKDKTVLTGQTLLIIALSLYLRMPW